MNISFISNKEIKPDEEIKGSEIREAIFNFIKMNYPTFTENDVISIYEMNLFRRMYLTYLIQQEKGEVETIDKDVLEAIRTNSILSEQIQEKALNQPTLGERVADKVADFGGSWTFITIFLSFIVLWMILNVALLQSNAYDPYPFILLNLILSCIAAIQAPIIMMSQNRQEQKDRQRAELDYKINLKAELEIKLLGEKIDHLLVNQNRKLLEIQEVQIDYLDDLMKALKNNSINKTND